jgi:bacteriocin-like protein
MNTNTKTSEARELTDDELNTVSGGIIFVGGRPLILSEAPLNPQPLPPSPPPGDFLRF